jgi:hypothetical protein
MIILRGLNAVGAFRRGGAPRRAYAVESWRREARVRRDELRMEFARRSPNRDQYGLNYKMQVIPEIIHRQNRRTTGCRHRSRRGQPI